jgi:hypothetical protein
METLVFITIPEKTTYNLTNQDMKPISCTQNSCNIMNNNIIDHLQPTTLQPIRKQFYPVIENTIPNPYGVADEAIELMRQRPIGERLTSCYVRSSVDGTDYNGDMLPLSSVLSANSPTVEAMRIERNLVERRCKEDKLPLFTPGCVLSYSFTEGKYYPIHYTCLLDFEILHEDNAKIDFHELKQDLANLPQIYYCGLATNGIDLFCIVPILAPQRYTSHARALRELFNKNGVIIRTYYQITHTRPLSSDPNGYFNDMAIEFTKLF